MEPVLYQILVACGVVMVAFTIAGYSKRGEEVGFYIFLFGAALLGHGTFQFPWHGILARFGQGFQSAGYMATLALISCLVLLLLSMLVGLKLSNGLVRLRPSLEKDDNFHRAVPIPAEEDLAGPNYSNIHC